MNEHDLLDAIGKTEETVLEASEKRHIPWKFLLTAAACLVLVLSTAFSLISPFLHSSPLPGQIISTERLTWLHTGNLSDNDSQGSAEQRLPPGQFSYQKSVEARVLDVLPDRYQFPNGICGSPQYRILRMELLDAIYAENMPSEFYYLLPEGLSAKLNQFDSLIMVVSQRGGEYNLMQNVDQSRMEAFSFLFTSGTFPPDYGALIACNDGKIDLSLWQLKGWKRENDYWQDALTDPENHLEYPGKQNRTVQEIKEAILRDIGKYGYSVHTNYVFSNTDLDWDEAQAVVEYTKPFENGYFSSSVSPGNSITYNRLINGFPTNEYIRVSTDDQTISHDVQFTYEDIESAPNLTFQIFFAAFRTPPKKKSGSPFVFRAAQGTYEKHGDHVFGIIRLSWGEKIKDAPHTYPVYQSTYSSYLLVYPNGKTVQAKNRTELDRLIAEYTG